MIDLTKPLTLSPFMIADIRSDDPGCVLSIVSCRVYRFSSERLEIIAPVELPDLLRHIRVNVNLGGMLALNIAGTITRRLKFDDYVLVEVSLARNPNRFDQFALQRIADAVLAKKAAYGDGPIRLGAITETGFDFSYIDGFLFSHPAFELSISGCTMHTTVFHRLGLQDYESYALVNHLAGKRIKERFGFFDRLVNVSALNDSLYGPLDVLLSCELYVWLIDGGMRRGALTLGPDCSECDPSSFFDLFSGFSRTPGQSDDVWTFKSCWFFDDPSTHSVLEKLRFSSG